VDEITNSQRVKVNTHRKIDIGGERESESERERERGGGDTLVERLARGRVIIIRA